MIMNKSEKQNEDFMAVMKEMFHSKLKEYREIYQKYMQYEQEEMPSDEALLIALMDIDIKVMKEEGQ